MSTITIQQLMSHGALSGERLFASLFAAYATTRRKTCGMCNKKKSMTTCVTLLKTCSVKYRVLLLSTFDLPESAQFKVVLQGDAFGLRVE